MKYLVVTTLATAALFAGCVHPPGDPSTDTKFVLDFNPVRSVVVDSWNVPPPRPLASNTGAGGIPTEPPVPPSYPTTVRIEGSGTIQEPWYNAAGAAYPILLREGNLSLSYAFDIDNGCKTLAEQAQQEGRTLHVEGFGTVAELAAMAAVCYPGPLPPQSGNGSAGGVPGTGTAQSASAIACPQPASPVPASKDGASDPQQPTYHCGCPPQFSSFVVKADKLVSCSLGDKIVLPPTPGQSPLPPVTPQPF